MMYMQQPRHIVDGVYICGLNAIRLQDWLESNCIFHVLKLFRDTEIATYGYDESLDSPLADLPSLNAGLMALKDRFTVLDLPLAPSSAIPGEAFDAGVRFLDNSVRSGKHVLLLSRAGTLRAPILIIAYMISERNYQFRDAFKQVFRHPAMFGIDLNPAAWESLFVHYELPYTVDDVRGWLDW